MSLSLEELWKSARDEEVVAAVGRWSSTNPEAQRVLANEVRRRGLAMEVPEITAAPSSTSSTSSEHANAMPAKSFLMAAAAVALVVLAVMYLR